MKVFQAERSLRTSGGLEIRDITEDVREAVLESGVTDGIACVYSPHTTCMVRVNEFETGFLEDFIRMLRRLVPSEKYYAHDDWDRRTENICPEDMEFGNGHSHCMAMLLGPAGESIPVQDGEAARACGSASSSSSTALETAAGSSRSSGSSENLPGNGKRGRRRPRFLGWKSLPGMPPPHRGPRGFPLCPRVSTLRPVPAPLCGSLTASPFRG